MNVTVAKSAGFCFGVRRAVNMVYEEAEQSEVPVYTYGPIIHNDEVVADLQQKGVQVIRDAAELCGLPKGKIIIRSHGISKAEHEKMQASGFEILDATCPFVHKIHKLVNEHSRQGYAIVIAGDREHPEVQGILGWVEQASAFTVQTPEEIEELPLKHGQKVCFVAQTTFNYKKFQELVEIIKKKGYDIIVLDTICNATEERQAEARTIARHSDVMIVVGDKNSSNTRKLYEISKKECENTYYIQTSSDLDYRQIQSINNVGITAGASTPNYIIEEVSKNVRNEL
jgi:4-hydroxy-3-methylbut-2-enyl diphosphate reductase